jgi:hypothetical protein
MPRIRTIKPEFPQSETIGKLSREARLLFVQLFTIVDDAGRSRAAPRMLASLLYPYDDDAHGLIDQWLDELVRHGAVRRYEIRGAHYLEIAKWLEHQKIDRPSPSRIPAPAPGDASSAPVTQSSDVHLFHVKPSNGREKVASIREASRAFDAESGPGEEGTLTPAAPVAARAPEHSFDEFWKAYPRRDGPNPRSPAERKFHALVSGGVDPAMMIAAVRKLAAEEAAKNNIGSRFIPQAMTWLSQQRWADHAAVAAVEVSTPALAIEDAVKMFAKTRHWSKYAGPEPGMTGCRASPELLARYGLAEDGRMIPKSMPSDLIRGWEYEQRSDHAQTKE